MKKRRSESDFKEMSYRMPDRAVTVYCNMISKLFKDSKIVIGGTESSLRRFAHYDFWDNKLRKSILLDSRADILVYGYGELQTVEIAKRLKNGMGIEGINGTCILAKEIPADFEMLPSFDEVNSDKHAFLRMQNKFDINKNLAQKFDNRYVLQYKAMEYTTKDLDFIYSLPYSREIPLSFREFKIVEFSVLTHRGCLGNCNFCSIAATSGKKVVSRSIESITDEVKRITQLPNFKGVVELSGASANMYGMDCNIADSCKNRCVDCEKLDKTHIRMLKLLRAVRNIHGVKRVFVKSGVRYDLALYSQEYIHEIIKHHIDKRLMIAPEHTNPDVLKLMNKGRKDHNIYEFIKLFKKASEQEKKKLELSYYIMVGHPGCTIENSLDLRDFTKHHPNTNFVQIFTPTPMTVSTCMYYTGLDPKTGSKVYVPYSYNEKKKQKNIALGRKPADERVKIKKGPIRRF
jgi:uncharacterized radical SAM protein YgiQ